MVQTRTPDIRCDTARRVQSGRALRATILSANLSSGLSIRLGEDARGRRARSLRALPPPLRVLRTSLVDGAQGDTDGCPRHRHRPGSHEKWTRQFLSLSARPRCQPFSSPESGDVSPWQLAEPRNVSTFSRSNSAARFARPRVRSCRDAIKMSSALRYQANAGASPRQDAPRV
jgi:hypothetical protein